MEYVVKICEDCEGTGKSYCNNDCYNCDGVGALLTEDAKKLISFLENYFHMIPKKGKDREWQES